LAITDCAGRRSSRVKWLKVFEKCKVCVFFVSLADFDQTMEEDPKTNRFEEAIFLFDFITLNKTLRQNVNSFILVLTKLDVLRERLKTTRLTDTFPEYSGDNDFESAKQFLLNKILEHDGGLGFKLKIIWSDISQVEDTKTMQSFLDAVLTKEEEAEEKLLLNY
jgi:guanine nucleotide-binding protein G(i) subunit alpha